MTAAVIRGSLWGLHLSVFQLITIGEIASAFPTRAGHCQSGPAVGEISGGSHGLSGSGRLSDANIHISFNNTELVSAQETTTIDDDFFNEAEGATSDGVAENNTLIAGMPYRMTLVRDNDATFRGFLVRLSSTADDVTIGNSIEAAFPVVDSNTQVLPSTGDAFGLTSACNPGVTALCHVLNDEKTIIESVFLFADSIARNTTTSAMEGDAVDGAIAIDLVLEITVVEENKPKSSEESPTGSDAWYYSSYPLRVLSYGNLTSESTVSPSPSSSTTGPTIEGENISAPTSEPSAGIAFEPTGEPSITPQPTSEERFEEGTLCKWWCHKMPAPWKPDGTSELAKCNLKYSCSECSQCLEDTDDPSRRTEL